MNENTINWVNDFGINETLHSVAQGLSGTYSRMAFNFPNHTEASLWKQKSIEWSNYDKGIKDMFIETKEAASIETIRLTGEYNKILIKEKNLSLNPA